MNEVRQSSAKIFISSRDSKYWVDPNYNTRLNVPIDPFVLRNNDSTHFILGLESLTIPLAIYMVSSANNKLLIDAIPFTIAEGNYTATSLETALNGLTPSIVWKLSSVTNCLTLTWVGAAKIFTGTATRLLGYNSGSSYSSGAVFPKTINLATTTGVVVRLDNIQTENRDNISGGSSILARIPINCSPFKVLSYFNSQPFYTTIQNRYISTIQVTLLDDSYQPLKLVGNPDWTIVLRLDFADKVQSKVEKSMIEALQTNTLVRSRGGI